MKLRHGKRIKSILIPFTLWLLSTIKKCVVKDTHREKEPSNKTPGFTKRKNIGIFVVSTSNQLFKTDS